MRLSSFAVAAVASTAALAQSDPLFYFAEKPGSHSVGFKVVEQYDYSRIYRHSTDELGETYQGERARPVQTLIWYPSTASRAKPMTVSDYGDLWATETRFGRPLISNKAKEWLSAMSPTLMRHLWAVRNALPVSGRFPIIIYAPSFSAMSWENADLCEYWASHGYVVIASPSMGVTSRDMTQDIAGINAQARDISFLIGYAQTLPNADTSKVAAAGYSWGGMSTLFAAARDNRIDVMVSLDGSIRYTPGFVKQAGDVHPEQMTIPMLYFAQQNFSLEYQDRYVSDAHRMGPNVLNAWTHGDLITVHMLGLTHQEFSSMSQRNEDMWMDFPNWQQADYGREDGIKGYAWVARYTLQFLNAYLKHDAAAKAYLERKPAENGALPHFMAVDFRAAMGMPVSFDGFRAEIGRQGFTRAENIYAAMQKKRSDFKLDEVAVNAWADDLIDRDHNAEAVILLQLNVKLYPESSAAQENLANAYQKSGQHRLAIESYQKALEKNPINFSEIEKKLNALQR